MPSMPLFLACAFLMTGGLFSFSDIKSAEGSVSAKSAQCASHSQTRYFRGIRQLDEFEFPQAIVAFQQEKATAPEPQTEKEKFDAGAKALLEADKLRKEGSRESLTHSIEKYKESIVLLGSIHDTENLPTAYNNLGFVYDDLGMKDEALDSYAKALDLSHAAGDRAGEATTISNLGRLYLSLGEYQKAIEAYARALPVAKELGDRDLEGVALVNLGAVYEALGEKLKAIEYYNQALPICRATGNRPNEARVLLNMGNAYHAIGERTKAHGLYQEALDIFITVDDRGGQATALNNLGMLLDSIGEKQKALEHYNRALPITREVGDRNLEGTCLSNLGMIYGSLGERQKALEYYDQALPLLHEVGDRKVESVVLNNIGMIYNALSANARALEYYEKSLGLARTLGDRQMEGACLNNMGMAYHELGEPKKALEYFELALPIVRQVGDPRLEAVILTNEGMSYHSFDENDKALGFLMQALPIIRTLRDRNLEATTLNNIGGAFNSKGDRKKAIGYFNEALPIARAVSDPGGEGLVLSNLMESWAALGRADISSFYGKQAINVFQSLRLNIRGLDKGLQKGYLDSIEVVYRVLADLLIGQGRLPEAQQVLGMLKEEEYFDFVQRDGNEASSISRQADLTPEERDLDKRYSEIADHVTALGVAYSSLREKQTRTTEEESQLVSLESQISTANQAFQHFLDEIEKSLGTTAGSSQKTFQLRESQGLMDTLRELGSGAVALYTVMGADKYRVILVTPDVQKAYESSIKSEDLNRKVLEFREALQNPRVDPRPLAQDLYKILVGPELSRDLDQAKAETLMWSLDGVLRYLPVAALHDGKKYMVERYRNVVFTPASQTRLKDQASSTWKAIAFGVSKAQPGFASLPAVTAELHGIIRDETEAKPGSGVLSGKIILDEAFTSSSMQSALRQHYQLVHIASHFQFRPGNETDSFLLLGDGTHLTLAQIKSLPNIFSGVDLLTISACNTATGDSGAQANGREVEGFGVLAQRQGAKAVLATLWPVADESTQLLMRQFYSLKGTNPDWTKAEALRQAQLSLMTGKPTAATPTGNERSPLLLSSSGQPNNALSFKPDPKAPFAHPYYWAPFILIGNWK